MLKVKLLPKVSGFFYNGIKYKPGDKFEVDSSLFRPDFMQDLTPNTLPKPTKKPEVKKRQKAKLVKPVATVLPEPETPTSEDAPKEVEAEEQSDS